MRRFIALAFVPLIVACTSSENPVAPVPSFPQGDEIAKAKPNPNRPDNIDLTVPGSFVRSTCEPTIINTLLFEEQITGAEPFQGEIRSSSIGRPAKKDRPVLGLGPANNVVPGEMFDRQVVDPLSSFPGITQTAWSPPDPSLAVGPNHIVETVNQSIAFFTKDGTLQFQQLLNADNGQSFFDEVNVGNFAFDPKCFYDHYSNRFFVLALEVYQDIEEAYITFAVSDDDDPNGVWFKYRTGAVIDVGDASYWVDYPGLGFDQNGFYVTGNLFFLSGDGGGFANVVFRSFEKTPLLNGQTAVYTDIRDSGAASVQVAQHFGNNSAPYFVSRTFLNELRVTALNNPFTNPSFTTVNIPIATANGPPSAPNGGNGNIDTLDGRLMNVHWRDGSLWTCHGIESNNGNRSIVRWYEIATGNWPNNGSPALIQSGNVNGPQGVHTFFPAIYTDVNNNAAMVMAYSSSSEFASVRATGRMSTDPLNSMGDIELLQSGSASTDGRWGDYFDIAIDPNDDQTFWMVGEYQSDQGGWRTSINSFVLFLLGDVNDDGLVNLLDVGPFIDVLSGAGFDPAADINGDGVVNLLDVQGFIDLLSG